MLNELLLIERGLVAAAFEIQNSHPDVKQPGKVDALRVRLGKDGVVVGVEFLAHKFVAKSWKFSEGQQNSFPFVQIKQALLSVPSDPEWHNGHFAGWQRKTLGQRRRLLQQLIQDYPARTNSWPKLSLIQSLTRRQTALEELRGGDAAAVPAVIERFITASRKPVGPLSRITTSLLEHLDDADNELIELAKTLLVEGGALYFEVCPSEFERDAADPSRQRGPVSIALSAGATNGFTGICALSGEKRKLLSGNFPQPNLPLLGQTYLFAKNNDIKAAGRYRRFATEAMPLGELLAARLAGTITELTVDHRKGKTWREVPSERPKQSDLLLAFVDRAPDAPMANVIADDGEPVADDGEPIDSITEFETRTERLIDAIKAKVGADFSDTPVQVCVLRKVDLGNSKVVCHRALTLKAIYKAATKWKAGERNLPQWLSISIPRTRGTKDMINARPLHVAPLQVPLLTRFEYIRGGVDTADLTGIPAQDSFGLFLDEGDAKRRAQSALRLILRRHGTLLAGLAHTVHKGSEHTKKFDAKVKLRPAALRTCSFLGVLLHKLNRSKELYMNESAFKLGQLLAVADAVHVGYCADMRGGDVPPTLLGNAVLNVAKANPQRALAVLCGRWKPYGGWARRVDVEKREKEIMASDQEKGQNRVAAIRVAISRFYRANEISSDLHGELTAMADDAFRAELLLGYIAGLPKRVSRQGQPGSNLHTDGGRHDSD